MNKDEELSVAIQIVAYAGSAFDYFNKSIEEAENGDFEKSSEFLKKGEEELNKAHNAQTDVLACEASGKPIPFSITMVHAQDHLTMAIFTERMAKHFIKVWEGKNKKC